MFCSHIEAFTLQDMHSLMLMVCSDVPLRVTRSAFKAATPLLPSGDLLKLIVILFHSVTLQGLHLAQRIQLPNACPH